MSRAVGIDFGTTNSVICVLDGCEPLVIPNQRGERVTPSVVAFTKEGDLLVGTAAKNQSVINHERTIKSVKRNIGDNFRMDIDGQEYNAIQIASIIISKLKDCAEVYLDEPVTEAIITVPAYFNDGQRQAVKRAGEIAGLNVMRLINEPTAAALSYGLSKKEQGQILVFDLGGGTFDVSILDISDDVYEVLATRGNNCLGGDDFDARLVHFICEEFRKSHGINLNEDRMALQKVIDAAEQAKKELSEANQTSINLPFISADEKGPKHLELTITRQKFEELIYDYMDEIFELVDATLDDAGTEHDEIDSVVLVGGSTRIPVVQKLLEDRFPNRVMRNVNPDECVASGAAIQAGVMKGNLRGLVLVDVAPLTLGIETENDVFIPIIDRNSCIPTTKSRIFTTVSDRQTSVEVHVLQGERARASQNYSLGKFALDGIPPDEKGAPRIEVIFDIDVNGIVHVRARDENTGQCNEIEINASDSITDEQIEKILQEATAHREEDELFLGRQLLIKQAKLLLTKIRDRIDSEEQLSDRMEIQELIEYIENVLRGNDIQQIRTAIETMSIYLNELAAV
ncbi:MAG TPA: molecular chaperone DnaK [bacterium]|nr:molecular chaperone DnaK [bacterium]